MSNTAVSLKRHLNCSVYKHSNKRVLVFTPNSDNNVDLIFKRLMVIEDLEERRELVYAAGLETTVMARPHSKYVIILTKIKVSAITLECLHHGFTEIILKSEKNESKRT